MRRLPQRRIKNPANVALFSGVSVPSLSFTVPTIDLSPLNGLTAQINAGILAAQAKNSMQAQPVLPGTETTLGSAPGNIANDATKGHPHPTTSGASIDISGSDTDHADQPILEPSGFDGSKAGALASCFDASLRGGKRSALTAAVTPRVAIRSSQAIPDLIASQTRRGILLLVAPRRGGAG